MANNPYSIFPDDLGEEALSLPEAALKHESTRQSYAKKEKRDYSAAYAMIAAPKAAAETAEIADALAIKAPKTAFIGHGIVPKAATPLDTSGIKQFLAGEDPSGGHLFEFSFDEALLGRLRCSLSSSDGLLKAIFYAGSYETARKVEEKLPLLREKLLKSGLKVDELAVKVE